MKTVWILAAVGVVATASFGDDHDVMQSADFGKLNPKSDFVGLPIGGRWKPKGRKL